MDALLLDLKKHDVRMEFNSDDVTVPGIILRFTKDNYHKQYILDFDLITNVNINLTDVLYTYLTDFVIEVESIKMESEINKT